jgi:hypothetical protein
VPQLEGQLRQLERRPRTSGRDQIDHPRGGKDDIANACAGALWLASRQSSSTRDDASSVTRAITSYDPLTRDTDTAPAFANVRHPHLLPINLRMQLQLHDSYSSAITDYDIFSR